MKKFAQQSVQQSIQQSIQEPSQCIYCVKYIKKLTQKIFTISCICLLFFGTFNVSNIAKAANDSAKERYNIYYNNGVTYFKDKKYSSAIDEFKKVLRYAPYDATVRNALCAAYVSRAEYYLNTEKQPKKAINDLRNAIFYMKYWDGTDTAMASKAASVEANLNQLIKRYEKLATADLVFQNAKNLRAQGELAASAYEFNKLFSDPKYKYQSYIIASDIYKSLNNEKKAIDTIRLAIQVKPNDAMAHFKYGVILDGIKNDAAAMDEYSKALQYSDKDKEALDALQNLWMARSINNAKDPQALVNLGTVLQKKGEFELAKAQYLKAKVLNPDDPAILVNLASLYAQSNDETGAINMYNEMLQKNPNDINVLYYKAASFEKMKDFRSAILIYKKILSVKADEVDAKNAVNNLLSNLKGEELYTYLLSEAQANPNSYDAQFNYAFQMHKAKKYPEAVAYYNKALVLNKIKPEPYINLAQIYRLQNDTVQANAILQNGLAAIPNNKDLLVLKDDLSKEAAGDLYNQASKLFEAKDYKGALALYLKIPYQTPEVLSSIAQSYFEMNDNQNAIMYFNKVLAKTPKDTQAMYFIANAYVNLNDNETAKSYLNKILVLEPANTDAKSALAAIQQGTEGKELDFAISLYEGKKYDDALVAFDKVLQADSKNAYALYYKGAIYDDNGKKNEAIEEYKKSIMADPNFSLSYYALAVVLDNKEDYKNAVGYYDKFLNIKTKEGIQDSYVKYVQGRVKELKSYLAGAVQK